MENNILDREATIEEINLSIQERKEECCKYCILNPEVAEEWSDEELIEYAKSLGIEPVSQM
jgi:hypothetical protein